MNRETSLNRRSRRSIGQVYRVPPYIYSISSRILSYFSFFFHAATDNQRINYCLKSSISIPSKRNNLENFPILPSFRSDNRFLSNRMNNTAIWINFSKGIRSSRNLNSIHRIVRRLIIPGKQGDDVTPLRFEE